MSIPNLANYSNANLAARLTLLRGALQAARDEDTRHKIEREIRDTNIEIESRSGESEP